MLSVLNKINPCVEKEPEVPEDRHIVVQQRPVRHAYYDLVGETSSSNPDTIRLIERVEMASATTPLLGPKSFQATRTSSVVFPSRDPYGPSPSRAAFTTVQSESPPSCSLDGKTMTYDDATIEQYFPATPTSIPKQQSGCTWAHSKPSSTASEQKPYDCPRTEGVKATFTTGDDGRCSLVLKDTPGRSLGSMVNGTYQVNDGKETYATDDGSRFFEGTNGWEGFTPAKNNHGQGWTLASFCGGD